MFNQNLKKLINLAKRTNSPLIITDSQGEEPVVLMSVDQYEDLAAGFDPSGLDLIDEEDWYEDYAGEPPLMSDEVDSMPEETEELMPEEEMFKGEIESEPNIDAQNKGQIGAEEQFYLEPIE